MAQEYIIPTAEGRDRGNRIVNDKEGILADMVSINAALDGNGPVADDPFDLNTLLAESLQAKKDEQNVKAARSILASKDSSARMTPEAKQALQDSVRAWELKKEWESAAIVAMFHRQFCDGCGRYNVRFLQMFQRQQHRHSRASRWLNLDGLAPVAGLPKEAKYEESHCPTCEECARDAGYPVED